MTDHWSSFQTEYPNNLLRNTARRSINAQYSLVIDIDMTPNEGLYGDFMVFAEKNKLFEKMNSFYYGKTNSNYINVIICHYGTFNFCCEAWFTEPFHLELMGWNICNASLCYTAENCSDELLRHCWPNN